MIAEQGVVPPDTPEELAGVGVDQELVRIEAVTGLGLIGAVDPIAVDCARPRGWQVAVPDLVGVFRQFDTLKFGFSGIVEQA